MKRIILILALLPFLAVSAHAQSLVVGDANGDGSLDISDVVTVVNRVLEGNSVSYQSCPDNHHPHLIDLGLPSGTLWSCCNVDAKKPQDEGGYYAWGEAEVKSSYDWSNYTHCDGTDSSCHNLGGDIGGTANDAAHKNWGSWWRIPSNTAWEELSNNCTYEWTTVNGVQGGKLTSKINGASIFLPAAGTRWETDLEDVSNGGSYWASIQYQRTINWAFCVYFYSDDFLPLMLGDLAYGRSIRPIQSSCDVNGDGSTDISDVVFVVNRILEGKIAYRACPDNNHPHKIDLGLPSGTLWSCCNVGTRNPSNSGSYYAWGETAPKYYYYATTYIHCDDDDMDKCHNIGSSIIGTEYDAAHVQWGDSWQMPSLNQVNELLAKCSREWTKQGSLNGIKFTGPNGSSIFLSAAGYVLEDGYYFYNQSGYYWMGEMNTNSLPFAYLMRIYENGHQLSYFYREAGASIRPVAK